MNEPGMRLRCPRPAALTLNLHENASLDRLAMITV